MANKSANKKESKNVTASQIGCAWQKVKHIHKLFQEANIKFYYIHRMSLKCNKISCFSSLESFKILIVNYSYRTAKKKKKEQATK